MKENIVHILGASGSGTTTLAKAISENWGYSHFDADDYFWLPVDPPSTVRREVTERQELLSADIEKADKCVISGSMCGWGDIFIPRFRLVIYISTPVDIRIERLQKRETARFDSRILPGGDMYQDYIDFIEWAKTYDTADENSRSRALHIKWLEMAKCPVIYIDGTQKVSEHLSELGELL